VSRSSSTSTPTPVALSCCAVTSTPVTASPSMMGGKVHDTATAHNRRSPAGRRRW
jgi:hypothetical protein